MDDAEVRKAAMENVIRDKSQKIINLSARVSKQPIDNRSGSAYRQSSDELSAARKELKVLTKEYMTMLKEIYRK